MSKKAFRVPAALIAAVVTGCGWSHGIMPWTRPVGDIDAPVQNPLMAPVADREFLWNQVVDTIDDYFRIAQEERVKLIGGVLTEGRIDTYPTVGSTLLEPWGRDSTPGYERFHSTLQSIRRRALVRVIPADGGYLIHVAVHKEKEELAQSEHALVGRAVRKHDGLLRQPDTDQVLTGDRFAGTAATLGWVPLGRDFSLEQRILRQLRGRLFDASGL